MGPNSHFIPLVLILLEVDTLTLRFFSDLNCANSEIKSVAEMKPMESDDIIVWTSSFG